MIKDVVFRSSKLLNYAARNYKVNISIRKKLKIYHICVSLVCLAANA
uniref:Uncharacterized protein n=1 Tax=Arundo donax TaxID=35708 RepID=A0A0A9B5Q4_ARUDO